jgi:hypothetical protein
MPSRLGRSRRPWEALPVPGWAGTATPASDGVLWSSMNAVTSASRRTPVLVIVLLSYLMIVLDISIVITALPEIDQGLGFSYPDRGCDSKRNLRSVIHRLLIPL